MPNIIVYNVSARSFNGLQDVNGNTIDLHKGESIEMDEVVGLKLINAYPKHLKSTPTLRTQSSEELRRLKQSIDDKAKALEAKEKDLATREADLVAREAALLEKLALANASDSAPKVAFNLSKG
jgi:hypothetical protein